MLALLLAAAWAEERMFNGRDLTGWEVVGGGSWTVSEGVLTGQCKTADDQGVLVYRKSVRDFSARFEFRIAGGNSGFYFRTERIREQPLVRGFQAEIDAIHDVGGIWETGGRGWIFQPTPAIHARARFVPGEWTSMEVEAVGPRYRVRLNGATITDIVDPAGRREGAIALQLHGGMDMRVDFRNLYLRPTSVWD